MRHRRDLEAYAGLLLTDDGGDAGRAQSALLELLDNPLIQRLMNRLFGVEGDRRFREVAPLRFGGRLGRTFRSTLGGKCFRAS